MDCYTCHNQAVYRHVLADSRVVGLCRNHKVMFCKIIKTSKTLVSEKVWEIISKNLTDLDDIIRGGESMEIGKVQQGDGSPFLSRKTVQEKNINKVKIIDEPILVDTEYEGKSTGQKPQCTVETNVEDPKHCKWQMNKATRNYFAEKFGTDSNNWIGKEIEIKVASAGNAQPSIYPKEVSLEKVY